MYLGFGSRVQGVCYVGTYFWYIIVIVFVYEYSLDLFKCKVKNVL